MSRKINVNPGQYKVAGREKQGEDIVHHEHKARAAVKSKELRSDGRRGKNRKQGKRGK